MICYFLSPLNNSPSIKKDIKPQDKDPSERELATCCEIGKGVQERFRTRRSKGHSPACRAQSTEKLNCSETSRGLLEQLPRAGQGHREALWLREQPHGAGLGKGGDKAEDRPLKAKMQGLHPQVCPAAVQPAQPLQVLVSESLVHIN